ncbi:MAG TPA: Crp/Fnr family transcriptional regulator [Acidimicrobiia bacterium]|nr:Crp/Fnr family transcriptional regulator [Acidimicrobiia bacterium]
MTAPPQQLERHAEWIGQFLGRPDLAPLDHDDIVELATLLREERYPAGTTIFRTGEAPTRVGVVRQGAIAFSRDLNGRRVVLHILRPGDALGDIGVILRMTAPHDGLALEDTLVLTVDSVEFHRLLERRPRVALRWLSLLSARLIGYQARVTELLAGGIEAQVASALIGRAVRGRVNLNQAHLAELIGGSRSSVNRVLRQLEEQNLVRLRYSQIEILDEAALRVVAGHP